MGKVFGNIRDFRDSYHIGNRLPRNPFDPIHLEDKLEWCNVCKMDVDVQVETASAGGVDVYRKRCMRCGKVIQHGIGRRHIDGSIKKPLPKEARAFIKKTGRDRR
jgi:hypothetical protein